jgi:hypothetical protein
VFRQDASAKASSAWYFRGLPGHNPDDPIGNARADQSASGDDWQKALSAAGRHGGQHVTHLHLVGGDSLHDPVDQTLVATKLLVHRVPRIVAGEDIPPSALDNPVFILNGSSFRGWAKPGSDRKRKSVPA